jgi:hypothetical protein
MSSFDKLRTNGWEMRRGKVLALALIFREPQDERSLIYVRGELV